MPNPRTLSEAVKNVLPAFAWFLIGVGCAHLAHSELLIAAGLHAKGASTGAPLGTYDLLTGAVLLFLHWIKPIRMARRFYALATGQIDWSAG